MNIKIRRADTQVKVQRQDIFLAEQRKGGILRTIGHELEKYIFNPLVQVQRWMLQIEPGEKCFFSGMIIGGDFTEAGISYEEITSIIKSVKGLPISALFESIPHSHYDDLSQLALVVRTTIEISGCYSDIALKVLVDSINKGNSINNYLRLLQSIINKFGDASYAAIVSLPSLIGLPNEKILNLLSQIYENTGCNTYVKGRNDNQNIGDIPWTATQASFFSIPTLIESKMELEKIPEFLAQIYNLGDVLAIAFLHCMPLILKKGKGPKEFLSLVLANIDVFNGLNRISSTRFNCNLHSLYLYSEFSELFDFCESINLNNEQSLRLAETLVERTDFWQVSFALLSRGRFHDYEFKEPYHSIRTLSYELSIDFPIMEVKNSLEGINVFMQEISGNELIEKIFNKVRSETLTLKSEDHCFIERIIERIQIGKYITINEKRKLIEILYPKKCPKSHSSGDRDISGQDLVKIAGFSPDEAFDFFLNLFQIMGGSYLPTLFEAFISLLKCRDYSVERFYGVVIKTCIIRQQERRVGILVQESIPDLVRVGLSVEQIKDFFQKYISFTDQNKQQLVKKHLAESSPSNIDLCISSNGLEPKNIYEACKPFLDALSQSIKAGQDYLDSYSDVFGKILLSYGINNDEVDEIVYKQKHRGWPAD